LGGAEISILELVKRLAGFYQFHFILPDEGPLRSRAESVGARVWLLQWPKAFTRLGERNKSVDIAQLARIVVLAPGLLFTLSRLLKSINASVLITNGIKGHLLGAAAIRGRRTPLIWYLRDGLEGRRISSLLLSMVSFRCDAAICISRYIAQELRNMVSNTLPHDVLYNIVNLERFRPGLPLPADLNKDPGEIWFGIVGAVTPLKGQDLFLIAADKVSESVPEARFLIIGGNFYSTEQKIEFEETLKGMVSGSPLQEKVRFLGHRTDVPSIVANLDVLVQSNRGPEGLGRSVLEAMACSVPVIAVDRWGPKELIQDGITGLMFKPGDTESLARKMVELARQPERRGYLGENAREWIHSNLVPDNLAAGFRKIVDRAMSNAS
jgi:glycosyltransferase involved in cell wall biosynthesis